LLPVLLALMLKLTNNKRLMGPHVNSWFVNLMGWGLTIVLIVLTAILVVTTLLPI
jgi:Mn2+/Fe2+ NRAMP family transporter